MTEFVFQTRYKESSDRLNRSATLNEFDIKESILVIQYNFNSYDSDETKINLADHMFRNTQNIKIITTDHKYNTTVSPVIRRPIDENTDEIEYMIHAIMEIDT